MASLQSRQKGGFFFAPTRLDNLHAHKFQTQTVQARGPDRSAVHYNKPALVF